VSDRARPAGIRRWLLGDLPYAAMLVFAVVGVGLTSFQSAYRHSYWMLLAPVYAVIVIASRWRDLETSAARMRLLATQALHWFAFVAAMWLLFLPDVRGVVSDNATSLALLILLALGTFVAGVHSGSWRIGTVGIFLAVSVPGVAWIQESVVLLAVAGLLLAAIGAAFWWMWRREGRDR